jgi:tRNA pseudouridine38-40 synthase
MDIYRYFLELSYMGGNYCGWQIQPGLPSVQKTLEDALGKLFREKITLTGAGRTDTGVHAQHYTAHFDSRLNPTKMGKLNLVYKLNRILPHDISIKSIRPVVLDAHARYSAISRTYKYYICRQKDPFWFKRAWLMERHLNIMAIKEVSKTLLNYNDFESFSKSNTQVNNYMCKISAADWLEEEHLLIFTITADRFLRNMVRAIVGTLIDVGLGKIDKDEFVRVIESRNRSKAGFSVPGYGLYFMGATYEDSLFEADHFIKETGDRNMGSE